MNYTKKELGWMASMKRANYDFVRGTRKDILLSPSREDIAFGVPGDDSLCVIARSIHSFTWKGKRIFKQGWIGKKRAYLEVVGKKVIEIYDLPVDTRVRIRNWEVARISGMRQGAFEAWAGYDKTKKPLVVISPSEFNRKRDQPIHKPKKSKRCTLCHKVNGVLVRCNRHKKDRVRQPTRFMGGGALHAEAAAA